MGIRDSPVFVPRHGESRKQQMPAGVTNETIGNRFVKRGGYRKCVCTAVLSQSAAIAAGQPRDCEEGPVDVPFWMSAYPSVSWGRRFQFRFDLIGDCTAVFSCWSFFFLFSYGKISHFLHCTRRLSSVRRSGVGCDTRVRSEAGIEPLTNVSCSAIGDRHEIG